METFDNQEQETPDQKFQDAFNSGYILAHHNPDFLEQILFEIGDSDKNTTDGLLWGKWQFENELQMNKVNEFEQIRSKSRDKDREMER